MSIRLGDMEIKVESCQNSRRNLDVFALPNFRGRAFQTLYSHQHPCPAAHSLEKLREDPITNPEVIWAHALNFMANFKFLQFVFFFFGGGGTRSPLGRALRSLGLGQPPTRVKI